MLRINKIKIFLAIIFLFNIAFCLEIAPYANNEYSSDSELYPYSNQSLFCSAFGVDIYHEKDSISLKSNFSYHLVSGINEQPNKFNFFQGLGYIENNPGLSPNQFNYFLTTIEAMYRTERIDFFSGLSNPIWGPGVNSIILSDKAPPFFNVSYDWKVTDKLQYTHLYGKLNSKMEDTTYSFLYEDDSSRFAEIPRSINAHRIDYSLTDGIELGLYEVIVYGGSRSIEPYYFLPVIPFLPIQTYLGDIDNDMLGAYLDMSIKNISFYSSILIDEWTPPDTFKKEHKNWFIYQIGMNIDTKFLSDNSGSIKIEYIFSDNRVYSHKFPINNFYSYGYPMGFWAGPHAEQLYLAVRQSFGDLDINAEISVSKRGESIYGYNNNFVARYSGVVEKKEAYYLSILYKYNERFDIKLGISLINWHNAGFDPLDLSQPTNSISKENFQIGINYHFKEYRL